MGRKRSQLEYLDSYGLFPRKKSSPLLTKIVSEVAQEENIKLHNFHISVGAHTDSIPFHLRKYDILNFTTRSAAIYSHSKEDTPDKVDLQILKETYRIVMKSIIRLDTYNKQEDKPLY